MKISSNMLALLAGAAGIGAGYLLAKKLSPAPAQQQGGISFSLPTQPKMSGEYNTGIPLSDNAYRDGINTLLLVDY